MIVEVCVYFGQSVSWTTQQLNFTLACVSCDESFKKLLLTLFGQSLTITFASYIFSGQVLGVFCHFRAHFVLPSSDQLQHKCFDPLKILIYTA